MKAYPQFKWMPIEEQYAPMGGMDLRDYFAAKAMQGFMNCYGHNIKFTKDELIATASYDLADAMMEARNNNAE